MWFGENSPLVDVTDSDLSRRLDRRAEVDTPNSLTCRAARHYQVTSISSVGQRLLGLAKELFCQRLVKPGHDGVPGRVLIESNLRLGRSGHESE